MEGEDLSMDPDQVGSLKYREYHDVQVPRIKIQRRVQVRAAMTMMTVHPHLAVHHRLQIAGVAVAVPLLAARHRHPQMNKTSLLQGNNQVGVHLTGSLPYHEILITARLQRPLLARLVR